MLIKEEKQGRAKAVLTETVIGFMAVTESRAPWQLARLLFELNFSPRLTTYNDCSRAVKQLMTQGSLVEDEHGLLRDACSF